MQRPLYMQPIDAMEYGIIDKIIEEEKDVAAILDDVKSAEQWDKEVQTLLFQVCSSL